MRKLFALLLAMSTLALVVIWMPGRDSDRQLAVVTEIAGKGLARVQAPTDHNRPLPDAASAASKSDPTGGERRTRSFSPDLALVPSDRTAPPRVAPSETTPAPPARVAPTSTGELKVASGVRQPTPVNPPRLTSSTPSDESGRYELVRNLQRELKRVGCYWGEIDGSWGAGSKRAMGAFTERANSALPFEQPDYILLSLVQSFSGQACGKGCPSDQTMADGRCTPTVVLAQSGNRQKQREKLAASSRSAPSENGWAATVQATPESSYAPTIAAAPLPGRMAVGGPRSENAPVSDPSGLTTSARPRAATSSGASRTATTPQRRARSAYSSYARPVVVYRPSRSAYYYRPAPRSTARRGIGFADVFR